MKFIILEEANNPDDSLFAYIDETKIHNDFDSGKTVATIMYFKGNEGRGDKLAQIKVTLSENYISDTYHLAGTASDEQKMQAALDAAKKIFEDKGIPSKYFSAIFMSQGSILYTNLPDSQAV